MPYYHSLRSIYTLTKIPILISLIASVLDHIYQDSSSGVVLLVSTLNICVLDSNSNPDKA